MSRAKRKLSKDEQDLEIQKLQERKQRDAAMGYKYSPCKFCGVAVRWRGKHEPTHCGSEECAKKFMEAQMQEKREKSAENNRAET